MSPSETRSESPPTPEQSTPEQGPDRFRYGIEHECAVLRDGAFADFRTLAHADLQAVVDALPVDPADYPQLRIGDQGIRHKRWYVEGYERFDDHGDLVRYDPKGIEIRTRIHDSVADAVAALRADLDLLADAAARAGLGLTTVSFNPVCSEYRIDPPLNDWERRYRAEVPEWGTEHLHMTTYGPDLNLSCAARGPAWAVDAGRKLTHYSPWLVPLSFSSPFRDGRPWGGLSARTEVRTGARPAVLVHLADDREHLPARPSLTQVTTAPAEFGRIEFKAFDSCPDPQLYGELFSLLTGLLLDEGLPGRATVPDGPAHRRVARAGLADDEVHAGTGVLLDAAGTALAGRDEDLARLESLRGRWARRESPATAMLAEHAAGRPVAGLPATG